MAKKDKLLEVFKNKLGEWVCGYCNSESNQPAATFREIKKLGYKFEEHSPNRWGKELYCRICSDYRTHYKLLSINPEFEEKNRISINPIQRNRILKLLGGKDAMTGASISSTPEIDHKIPWTRLDYDIDASKLTDKQIVEHFQLLTREHNLLKDRACGSCKINDIRPPFLGISFWYKGDSKYNNTCDGCGWYDCAKWREIVNEKLK
jgi:hypothetical protein